MAYKNKTKTISILNDLAPEAWIEINPVDAKKTSSNKWR